MFRKDSRSCWGSLDFSSLSHSRRSDLPLVTEVGREGKETIVYHSSFVNLSES